MIHGKAIVVKSTVVLLICGLLSSSSLAQTVPELRKKIQRLERELRELRRLLSQKEAELNHSDTPAGQAVSFDKLTSPAGTTRGARWRDILHPQSTAGEATEMLPSRDPRLQSSDEAGPGPRLTRLATGESLSCLLAGGSRLRLRARIEYPSLAGGAYLLKVTNQGKPLGPLLNKDLQFTYSDGRSFSYQNSDGTYKVFYSPDFRQNSLGQSPYRLTTSPGDAYLYEWLVPGTGQVEVLIEHAHSHQGEEISQPLILEILSVEAP